MEASIRRIIAEMERKDAYYKQAVQIEILSIVLLLMREYLDNTTQRKSSDNQQVQAVKNIISYLREHFLEHITIEELCTATGYSKFYLCHSFKKMTGNTIIQYVKMCIRDSFCRTLHRFLNGITKMFHRSFKPFFFHVFSSSFIHVVCMYLGK